MHEALHCRRTPVTELQRDDRLCLAVETGTGRLLARGDISELRHLE